MKLNEDTKTYHFGFMGFMGFWGMQAFALHNPWYFLGFCFFAYFNYFKLAPGKWSNLKYLGLLSIAGPIVTILGVFKVFTV